MDNPGGRRRGRDPEVRSFDESVEILAVFRAARLFRSAFDDWITTEGSVRAAVAVSTFARAKRRVELTRIVA